MTLHRATRFALAVGMLGLPGIARAQGFGLNEIGSCALARGFATTGAPCDDASSIYWNPGAVPKTHGLTALAGVAAVKLAGDFTQDTTLATHDMDVSTEWVPHLFVNYRTSGSLAYGLGVYVPYGLTSQWSDDFPGRFSALKASLHTIYVQPNVSYAITDDWSVGIGPVFGHLQRRARSRASTFRSRRRRAGSDLRPARHPEAHRVRSRHAEGERRCVGREPRRARPHQHELGCRGALPLADVVQVRRRRRDLPQITTGLFSREHPLGAPAVRPSTRSSRRVRAPAAPLVAQKVKTRITHPAQVQSGFGYNGFKNTTIERDYAWVGWKAFKELPVDFQEAPRSRPLRELQQLSASDSASSTATSAVRRLRAGVAATATAAPDETVTPLLPEQDRAYGSIGGRYPINKTFSVDGAYSHIFTPGRRGRIDERTSPRRPPISSTAAPSLCSEHPLDQPASLPLTAPGDH